jgi:8-oxo-dGTP pyrophosphatase MutT (NUDIX family)
LLKDKKTVYSGKIVTLETACATLPNGHTLEMEVVRHPGGSAVVAVNERRQVCLLKQYRCVLDQWLWELPAGKNDYNEPPLTTAQRELEEEAGVRATQWLDLGFMISSPGVFTEKVYLYLARDLSDVAQNNEDHEVFDVHWVGFDQALDWTISGEISDAKSVIGLYRAVQKLGLKG